MKKGQSPASTENYKGRQKGAYSARREQLLPTIKQLILEDLSISQVARRLGIDFNTVIRWIESDGELNDYMTRVSVVAKKVVMTEMFRTLGDSLPRLAELTQSPNGALAVRATGQLTQTYDMLQRAFREESAMEELEARLAAIQEAQSELGHSSGHPALQPVDVEVHSSDTAESLPVVIDADEPEALSALGRAREKHSLPSAGGSTGIPVSAVTLVQIAPSPVQEGGFLLRGPIGRSFRSSPPRSGEQNNLIKSRPIKSAIHPA